MKTGNVALLQLCSGKNTKHNLAQIEQQIKQLPDTVQLVLTPENALLFADAATYRKQAEAEGTYHYKTQSAQWLSATMCGSSLDQCH